ncbi:hypothetical protein R1sor_006732 [Riccia sorocarpa]|uniref:Uncharacterized protein n=1 Tax=Riccia sorocarpa TaxID=122646 RepID=A0ABD3HQJ3_9MARC
MFMKNFGVANLLESGVCCCAWYFVVLQLVRNLLSHVDQHSQTIETAKLQAIGTRNMAFTEVETRSEKLREQRNVIADKQEQLERLNAELKSLVMVKQEQEVLIAHLSDSSLPGQ